MTFPIWPTTLQDPEAPFTGDLKKPLDFGKTNDLGAFESNRRFTRAFSTGSAKLILKNNANPLLSDMNIFRSFWRITLNDGLSYFTADWIGYLGFKGYVGRLVSFKMTTIGSVANASLSLELKPFVQLDNQMINPSPWPSKSNA